MDGCWHHADRLPEHLWKGGVEWGGMKKCEIVGYRNNEQGTFQHLTYPNLGDAVNAVCRSKIDVQ